MNTVPLYVRTRKLLRAQVESLHPGDSIPVQADLEKQFGLSHIAVRRAVEDLLLREQDRGTFIQSGKPAHDLNLNTGWTEPLKRLGFTPKSARLKLRLETAKA